MTNITEVHFAGGDTVEVAWVDGDEALESRFTTTIAHDEDIAFLNTEDAELEECIRQMQELDRIRHNHLG